MDTFITVDMCIFIVMAFLWTPLIKNQILRYVVYKPHLLLLLLLLPYDGAKPKQTQHYSQSVSHGNRNTDYVTTRDSTPPSGHPRYENTYMKPDVYTQSNNVSPYSDYRNYDQHRVRTVNDHTNYRNYTQRYNDRFVNKHHNQRQNNAVSSTYASKQKN